jgi:hypothetical protein
MYMIIFGKKAKSASENFQIKFVYVECTDVLLFVASHVIFHGTLYAFTRIKFLNSKLLVTDEFITVF